MRRTTTAKLGAGLTAAALALTLGTGPATADDGSQTARMKAVKPDLTVTKAPTGRSYSTGPKASGLGARRVVPTADITGFGQKSVILDRPGTFLYEGAPTVTNTAGIARVRSRLTVGGVIGGFQELYPDGVVLRSKSPVGKATLGPSVIYYNDGGATPPTSDPTISGTFYIRRATTSKAKVAFKVTRTGSKVKFHASGWTIFKPSTGKNVAIRSIKLQYRHSNGRYSTYKTISLNTYGNGSYTKTTSTKRRYRLLIPTTDSVYGSLSQTSPKM